MAVKTMSVLRPRRPPDPPNIDDDDGGGGMMQKYDKAECLVFCILPPVIFNPAAGARQPGRQTIYYFLEPL